MTDRAAATNDALRVASPALDELLSPLGRRAAFPPDIPFQAAQARGKAFNGTIGQITDGAGQALPLPSLAAGLEGLPSAARNRALLYSPVEGAAELRHAWRDWQRHHGRDEVPSTLPLVTVGLTHGLSLVADLFAGEGRAVAVAAPFWGNYRQAFALRTGARVLGAPAYAEGRYQPRALAEALKDLAPGEPAVAILNIPSNPGGYSPTRGEREALVGSLLEVAEARPLLVVCDDAYTGLVFEEEIPGASPFWELAGRHPNLVPVKVDGVTKELSFFGGRVGFLTFPFEPDSEVAMALESKVKCLLRAALGSPVSASQQLVLQALEAPDLAEQVEAIRQELSLRYQALRRALADLPSDLLRPLPCNSGCFALVELPEGLGLSSEEVRLHLLERHDTGLVAIAPRYLRIAFCSVAAEALPELVARLRQGVAELAALRRGPKGP